MKKSTVYYVVVSSFILDKLEAGFYFISLSLKDRSIILYNIIQPRTDFRMKAYFTEDEALNWINNTTLYDAYVAQFQNESFVRSWGIVEFIRRCKIEKL